MASVYESPTRASFPLIPSFPWYLLFPLLQYLERTLCLGHHAGHLNAQDPILLYASGRLVLVRKLF
jgi:hypothetical protein